MIGALVKRLFGRNRTTINVPDGADVSVEVRLAGGGRQTAATPSGAGDRPKTPPSGPNRRG